MSIRYNPPPTLPHQTRIEQSVGCVTSVFCTSLQAPSGQDLCLSLLSPAPKILSCKKKEVCKYLLNEKTIATSQKNCCVQMVKRFNWFSMSQKENLGEGQIQFSGLSTKSADSKKNPPDHMEIKKGSVCFYNLGLQFCR